MTGLRLTDVDALVPLNMLWSGSSRLEIRSARLHVSMAALTSIVEHYKLDLTIEEFAPDGEPHVVVNANLHDLAPDVRGTLELTATMAGRLRIRLVAVRCGVPLPRGLAARYIRSELPAISGVRVGRGRTLAEIDVEKLGESLGVSLSTVQDVAVVSDAVVITFGSSTR